MKKSSNKTSAIEVIKHVLYIVVIFLVGCAAIVFSVLYVDAFDSGFFYNYSSVIIAVTVALITSLTFTSILFYELSREFIYKLCFLTIILIALALIIIYVMRVSGFFDKIDSIEDFREYISSFGGYAVFLFILIQLLQVVILPIPAFITVGAGVLLFGALKGAIYSCIGIIAGSIISFLIGRLFGKKVATWLVGKESLEKGLKAVKGKDKIILTFMFLFPFFPDDVLCFVAGITTISPLFFIIMIFITRIISIFASCYSMNNSIIPYDTWWGILLWIVFFSITIILTILIYKKGEKIEKFFYKRKSKNKSDKN